MVSFLISSQSESLLMVMPSMNTMRRAWRWTPILHEEER